MIKPVLLYTDRFLHNKCNVVTNFADPELAQLANDLIETMLDYHGIGLAANQISVNKNLAVLYLENKTKIIVVVNPKIICYNKETMIMGEGCLSAPGILVNVNRPTLVEFEYQNLNGEKKNMKLEGLDCRILFHEWYHLQGQLISDGLKL